LERTDRADPIVKKLKTLASDPSFRKLLSERLDPHAVCFKTLKVPPACPFEKTEIELPIRVDARKLNEDPPANISSTDTQDPKVCFENKDTADPKRLTLRTLRLLWSM
jgi:hypothetical protein